MADNSITTIQLKRRVADSTVSDSDLKSKLSDGEPLLDQKENKNHLFIKSGNEFIEFPNKESIGADISNAVANEAGLRAAGDGRLKGYVDNFFGENALESFDPFVAELSNIYSIDYSKPLVNHIGFVGGARAWKNLDRVYKDSAGKYHCKQGLRNFSNVFESSYTTENSDNASFSVAGDLYYIPRAWRITNTLNYQMIKERYIIRNREAFLNGTLNIEIRFKDSASELYYAYITWSDVVGEYIPQFKLYYDNTNSNDLKVFLLMEARTNRTIEFIPVSIYNNPDISSCYNEELFYTGLNDSKYEFITAVAGTEVEESTHSASYPFAKIEPVGMSLDLNDEMYCKTGRWYFHNRDDKDPKQWLNMPGDCNNGWLETFQNPNSSTSMICDQIFHRAGTINSNNNQTYVRGRDASGTWSKWHILLTSENGFVGDINTPVYFSSGVPKACTSLDLNTTGNAETASKFKSVRKIELTGDVTGSATTDGSNGWSINTTVQDDSHNHSISNVDDLETTLNGKALKPSADNTATEYYVILGGNSTTLRYSSTYAVKVKPSEGQLTASKFNATSDARLKENFKPLSTERSILDLPTYKFDFIDGAKNQIGCKAQDLQEICPEIVNEGNDGYLSIQESKIVYLLLEEVKKLRKEIDELKGV